MADYDHFDDEDGIENEIEGADPKALPDGGITFTAGPSVLRAIENEIVGAICVRLQQRVQAAVEKQLKELVDAAVTQAIGERAADLVQKHLDKPRQKTDAWGNPSGPIVSFADAIPGIAESYLAQPVNSDGRPDPTYGKVSRINWVIGQTVKAHIDPVISKTVTDITNLAKTTIAGKVGQFIAAELTPQIDAKAIEAKVKANG